MNKTASNKITKEYAIIKTLGIVGIMLVMLMNPANASGLSTLYDIDLTYSPSQPVAGSPVTLTAKYTSYDQPGYMFNGNCYFREMSNGNLIGYAPIIDNTATLNEVTFSPGYHEILVIGGDDYYATTDFRLYLYATESITTPEFPSIALPVVAVLGMIAIIGRKKD